jgi:predicted transcriptional regulator
VLLKRFNEDLKLDEAGDLHSGPHTRRGRLSIIANILDVAKRGTVKTRIMYGASLSFSQLGDYLSFLLDANLLKIVVNPSKSLYKTTEKGLQYLQCYMEIGELLKKEEQNIP